VFLGATLRGLKIRVSVVRFRPWPPLQNPLSPASEPPRMRVSALERVSLLPFCYSDAVPLSESDRFADAGSNRGRAMGCSAGSRRGAPAIIVRASGVVSKLVRGLDSQVLAPLPRRPLADQSGHLPRSSNGWRLCFRAQNHPGTGSKAEVNNNDGDHKARKYAGNRQG
jgi:hypothetical protein